MVFKTEKPLSQPSNLGMPDACHISLKLYVMVFLGISIFAILTLTRTIAWTQSSVLSKLRSTGRWWATGDKAQLSKKARDKLPLLGLKSVLLWSAVKWSKEKLVQIWNTITYSTGWSFIHTAVHVWNNLIDSTCSWREQWQWSPVFQELCTSTSPFSTMV